MSKKLDQAGLGQVLLSFRAELSELKRAVEMHWTGVEMGAAMVRFTNTVDQFAVGDGASSSDGINQKGLVGSGAGMSDAVQCFINGEAVV